MALHIEVFELVVRNDVIWATSVAYLNDTDEIRLGIRRFRKKLVQEIRTQNDELLSPKKRSAAPDLELVRELVESGNTTPSRGAHLDRGRWSVRAGHEPAG